MSFIGAKPTAVPLTASDITDGIISSAKITDGTIATADISDGAVTSVKTTGVGGANTPSFMAHRTATQSISNNTFTKIENNVEVFDTDNAYDHSSNYRFTIPSGKAGKYVIAVAINIHDLADTKFVESAIYKNGSEIKHDIVSASRTIPTSIKTITIDDASVGDYYEAYVKQRNDSTLNLNYAYGNVFYAYKLIT